MIFCTVKPPEEYMVTLPSGFTCGLWDTYGYDPALFCFISRISSAMFMYEPGFESIPPGVKVVEVPDQQDVANTMNQMVKGLTVREVQEKYNPIEMLSLFSREDISHLLFVKGFEVSAILEVMRLRVLQFRKYYRGPLQLEGGIQKVQFKSDLTKKEQEGLSEFILRMTILMSERGVKHVRV